MISASVASVGGLDREHADRYGLSSVSHHIHTDLSHVQQSSPSLNPETEIGFRPSRTGPLLGFWYPTACSPQVRAGKK